MDQVPALLQFFVDIGHAVRTFARALTELLGLWGLFLSLAVFATLFWIWVRPAVQLLARTVHLPWRLALIRYGMATGTVFRFFLGYGMKPKSLYSAARYRIEAELLDPRPARPQRFLFKNRQEYDAAEDRYAREVREWRARIRDRLGELIRGGNQGAQITVATCFDIYNALPGIEHYFRVLAASKEIAGSQADQFLSRVRVNTGFIAPLYLLGGLLVRFEEDWKPVIREYGQAVSRRSDPLRHRSLRSLQTFLFDCWLLWGPSIPLCTCPQWQGRRLVQFGYGDENNSIPLSRGEMPVPDSTALEAKGGGLPILAAPTSVTGILKWGPGMTAEEYCPAQRAVFDADAGRVVLESIEPIVLGGGRSEDVSRTYYSAYLWAMFVICDRNDRPLVAAERWRNLLPFFEHGNIAEASTYALLKRQLVSKALSSINTLLRETPDVRLRYVCALDESLCGWQVRYRPPAGQSIRELMEEMLRREEFKELAASHRLSIEPTPSFGGDYAACHLPALLDDYFRSILHGAGSDVALFRELTGSREDLDLLKEFYDSLYVREFPDPDERESLANMEHYLALKRDGGYGDNNYHIVVAMQDGKPVGGSIADFLEQAAAGVIEFLFVAEGARGKGIGRALLTFTEGLLEEDSLQLESKGTDPRLACIVAEMNDPFASPSVGDNVDPWDRARIWDKWGYAALDFPYVQPALSDSQKAVRSLLLIGKVLEPRWREPGIPATQVKMIVKEYMRWAMRIPMPEQTCAEYREIATHLDGQEAVRAVPLAAYVGQHPALPIHVNEIRGDRHADWQHAMELYRAAFGRGALTIDEADFQRALRLGRDEGIYHLWALRVTADGPVEGLASFFALPSTGFGGYVAFTGGMRGAKRLRPLVARIEKQLLRDQSTIREHPVDHRPTPRGWYIETALAADATPFLKLGFREVAIDYVHPALGPDRGATRARLLFKPLGRCYAPPRLIPGDLLSGLEEILRVVYGIRDPRSHPTYVSVASAVTSLTQVRFREA